jgi:hemolysin III
MPQSPDSSVVVEEKFSLPLFLFTVTVSLAALIGLVWLVAPAAIWQAQIAFRVGPFIVCFLAVHLLTCCFEYFFHRYVLHKPVVGFLSRFYKQHTLHHNLTRIGRRRTPGGRDVPFIENIYPVTTPEQGEASFFPWYTLFAFAAAMFPAFGLMQWLMPTWPWFFGGFGALAFALALYEIFHAIEHWSFERWAPLIESKNFGWFWRKVYSFHLRHHAVIDCNEGISGFFTLPVFDWVFGTFILPKTLFTDGTEWQAGEFKSPRPYAFIRWCDARADAIVKNRRAKARADTEATAAASATSDGLN